MTKNASISHTDKVEQPVRAFVESKLLLISGTSALDLVQFNTQRCSFSLDTEHAREMHTKLGAILARIDEERSGVPMSDKPTEAKPKLLIMEQLQEQRDDYRDALVAVRGAESDARGDIFIIHPDNPDEKLVTYIDRIIGDYKPVYVGPSGNHSETLPPEHLRNQEGYHWLHAERSLSASIAQWINGRWFATGERGSFSPQEMRRRGWEYLGPVTHRPLSAYIDG